MRSQTLIGNVGELDDAIAAERLRLLQSAGQVAVEFTEIAAGADATGKAPWNQSAVAVVKESAALVALQRLAMQAYLGDEAAAKAPVWAPPLQKPHLSLAYGNPACALSELAVPAPFVASAVAAWRCDPASLEGVEQWVEIARVKL